MELAIIASGGSVRTQFGGLQETASMAKEYRVGIVCTDRGQHARGRRPLSPDRQRRAHVAPHFLGTYQYAWQAGMMLTTSAIDSPLWRPSLLKLFRDCPPSAWWSARTGRARRPSTRVGLWMRTAAASDRSGVMRDRWSSAPSPRRTGHPGDRPIRSQGTSAGQGPF